MKDIIIDLNDKQAIEEQLNWLIKDFDKIFLEDEKQYGNTRFLFGKMENDEFQPHNLENNWEWSTFPFFYAAAQHEDLQELIYQFVQKIIQHTEAIGEFEYALWMDENPLGFCAAPALVEANKKYIDTHLRLYRNLDLDHIDIDGEEMLVDRILDKWGCCDETIKLLAARSSYIRTQLSYDHIQKVIDEKFPQIKKDRKIQNQFFQHVLNGIQYSPYYKNKRYDLIDSYIVNPSLELILDISQSYESGDMKKAIENLDFDNFPHLSVLVDELKGAELQAFIEEESEFEAMEKQQNTTLPIIIYRNIPLNFQVTLKGFKYTFLPQNSGYLSAPKIEVDGLTTILTDTSKMNNVSFNKSIYNFKNRPNMVEMSLEELDQAREMLKGIGVEKEVVIQLAFGEDTFDNVDLFYNNTIKQYQNVWKSVKSEIKEAPTGLRAYIYLKYNPADDNSQIWQKQKTRNYIHIFLKDKTPIYLMIMGEIEEEETQQIMNSLIIE